MGGIEHEESFSGAVGSCGGVQLSVVSRTPWFKEGMGSEYPVER